MITRGAARGLFGLLFGTSLAIAQDAAPKLDPPALVPPATAPAAGSDLRPSGPGTEAGTTENRPLLVIPGVTAPVPPKPGSRSVRPKVETHRRALEAFPHGP